MTDLPKPDFSLHLWRPITAEQFGLELHDFILVDSTATEADSILNAMWTLETGRWATVFYFHEEGSDEPVIEPKVMILHQEDERKGAKLLYFKRTE